MARLVAVLAALALGCQGTVAATQADGGAGPDAAAADSGTPAADAGIADAGRADSGAGLGIAARHPGDLGIASDPAVIWSEDFEEGSVAAVLARYDDAKNAAGMALASDRPAASGGQKSLSLTAGLGANATDFYKRLPDAEEWYVRWYAKYQPGTLWHHSGVWVGGYNPPSGWPNPGAGSKPDGDDRFSISVEPVFDVGGSAPRFDFYGYWMAMHSWMAQPSGSGAYYGNTLIHRNDFTVEEGGQWVCLELHVKLNTDLSSGAGAVLEVWKDDALVRRFDQAGPLGYWLRDKFCPEDADGAECTDYPATADTVLSLQWRTTAALKLNAFWPQNYITEGPDGALLFDDMVVARERVGCLAP